MKNLSEEPGWTRRRFLVGAGWLGVLGFPLAEVIRFGVDRIIGNDADSVSQDARAQGFLVHARRIGEICLRSRPITEGYSYREQEEVRSRLDSELREALEQRNELEMKCRLSECARSDHLEGNTVEIDGWILSRSEVDFFTLMALMEA